VTWPRVFCCVAILAASLTPAFVSTAAAQIGSEWTSVHEFEPSPERFTAEVRIGAYRPNLEPEFTTSFGGDLGPMLSLELDVHLFRIPYVGPIAIGASFGWVEWTGPARAESGTDANVGTTGMSLLPMALLAVLRVDVLARELNFPLIVSGKLGPDVGYYQTGVTGRLDAEGWSVGLRWAVQLGLELDFLEQRAANRLDQEWGINHSVVFFELYGSTMGQMGGNMLPLGTDLAWFAGLQVTF
jgi:hypothetical protein